MTLTASRTFLYSCQSFGQRLHTETSQNLQVEADFVVAALKIAEK